MRSPASPLLVRALLVLVFLASVLGLPAGQAQAATSITISGTAAGRVFDGVGAVSGGGGNAKLLYDYPEPQRGQILDYLFKPGYGANISLLKVEIGGDANSTDGAEPSHMHSADDQNYQRGYEWWLMEQAKARNPGIRLAALAWAAPGWIGTSDVWTNDMITYLVNYLRGAGNVHGLTIDYLGGWNENGWDSGWFVDLRKALDAGGFGHVRLVGADGGALVLDLAGSKTFDVISVQEDLNVGMRTQSFAVDRWTGSGWSEIATDTTIGHKKLVRPAAPVTTDRLRLRITGFRSAPAIASLSLFKRAAGSAQPGITAPLRSGLDSKCLDDDSAGSADGTRVQIYDCNGSLAQLWTVNSDGTVQILGKCLDAYGGGTANGTRVQLYTCHGGANQQFRASGGALVNPASGRCLDVRGFNSANGTQVVCGTATGVPTSAGLRSEPVTR